jgi:hypothetical protein
LILKGILQNSSLSNRGELMKALDQMSQPNPQAAEAAQMQQQAAMELAQAQVADLTSKAQKQSAEAQKTMIEAQMIPEEQRVKLVQAASTNLDSGDDFEKRLKLADMMLKEKTINLKAADIASNERIASLQMMTRARK